MINSKYNVGENVNYRTSLGDHRKGTVKQITEKNGEVFYQLACEGSSIIEVNENKILTLLNE